MSGNIWELCLDWFGTLAYGADPKGSSSVSLYGWGCGRVERGGGWDNGAANCTSSCRYYKWPADVDYQMGFRLVMTMSN